mgnify:CR=1 FL=1
MTDELKEKTDMIIRNIIKSIMIAVTLIPVLSASCIRFTEEDFKNCEQIVVTSVQDDVSGDTYTYTRGDAIDSSAEMRGKTFGIYASRTSNWSTHFTANATVSGTDQSAAISPPQYWPIDRIGSLKIFSWYPYSGAYSPTVDFTTPGQMAMSYSADADAANHVDVLAAVSEPAWGSGVTIAFRHMLAKVTFTFKKVDPAPAVVTVSRIEFRDVGKSGEYVVTSIPAATTKNGKANFVWSNITTGTITSIPATTDNTVTDTAKQIGDTFLMLPATAFSSTAKVVITTNIGVHEFLLRDLVASTQHSWESGEYINYNVTITNGAYQIDVQPLDWNDNPVNVIFDRDYYLKVSQTAIYLAANGVTVDLTAETNYNANPDTGYPAGAFLATFANPGTNVSNVDLGWATVTLTETSTSGGIYLYNIRIAVEDLEASSNRWAAYYINAGNLRHRMSVMQYAGDGVWLRASVQTDPDPDSPNRNILVVTSGAPGWWAWTVSALSDPDDILLNKETILGATGSTGNIYFYFKANALSGKKATLTFTNTNGSNPAAQIVVTSP